MFVNIISYAHYLLFDQLQEKGILVWVLKQEKVQM